MRFGIQHLRKRKELGKFQKNLEKFPHPHVKIRSLDNMLLVVAVIGPLVNLPQVIKIFSLKNATGVSAVTFSLFALFDIPWIVYGLVHKQKPIIISYTLWLITNLVVVVGTLVYS
ncbi:hypothetical protein KY360_06465 [Candidatus Woesearchaeota archaeon]|nr:hypothetical protein [Candidatus Woesearchaeota archaeon]